MNINGWMLAHNYITQVGAICLFLFIFQLNHSRSLSLSVQRFPKHSSLFICLCLLQLVSTASLSICYPLSRERFFLLFLEKGTCQRGQQCRLSEPFETIFSLDVNSAFEKRFFVRSLVMMNFWKRHVMLKLLINCSSDLSLSVNSTIFLGPKFPNKKIFNGS